LVYNNYEESSFSSVVQ